jgi:iron complex outermembrane receptor protein
MLDPGSTLAALLPSDESPVLDIFAMSPGGSDAPANIWAQPRFEQFSSSGEHVLGSADGAVGPLRLQFGLEQRAEAMQFSSSVGRVGRDVFGRFAHIELPLVRPDMNVFGVNQLTALAGARRDSFSDAGAVTRRHFELRWDVTDRLLLEGNVAQQYRPPTLFELNLPPVSVPIEIYDAKREEAVSVMLTSGGNPDLRPTTGKSTNIQASFASPNGLVVSVNYFAISLRDRVAVLPFQAVLAAEDRFPTRVVREQPNAGDVAAGRPGRLTSLNTTRDNVGRLFTRGVDLSIHKTFDAAYGSFTPRIDGTRIDAFRYSDSLEEGAPMIDRVGLAAEQGTIPRWRAVASLEWQRGAWGAKTFLRRIPSYKDIDGRDVGQQRLWDMNVSYQPNQHVTLALGVRDIANTSPHFAKIGAATGYDSSQWDPVGRRFMLTAKVSL